MCAERLPPSQVTSVRTLLISLFLLVAVPTVRAQVVQAQAGASSFLQAMAGSVVTVLSFIHRDSRCRNIRRQTCGGSV